VEDPSSSVVEESEWWEGGTLIYSYLAMELGVDCEVVECMAANLPFVVADCVLGLWKG